MIQFERQGPLYLPRYDVDTPERKIRRALRYGRLRRLQPQSAVTQVQNYTGDSGGSLVTSLATNSLTLTVGNLLCVWVTSQASSPVPNFSITHTLGDGTFTSTTGTTALTNGTTSYGQLFYMLSAPSGGTDAFTVHTSTAAKLTIDVTEFAPGGATMSLDVHSENNNAPTSTTYTPGAFTTTNADAVIFSGESVGGNVTITAGTGYTLGGHANVKRAGTEWRIVTSIASYEALFTSDTTKIYCCGSAAFKAVTASALVFEDDSFVVSRPAQDEPNVSVW